jgi:hypothetical protein
MSFPVSLLVMNPKPIESLKILTVQDIVIQFKLIQNTQVELLTFFMGPADKGLTRKCKDRLNQI